MSKKFINKYIYILAIFLCLFGIGEIKSYAAGYCSETEGTDLYHSTFHYISFYDDYGAPIYRWGGQLINTYNPYTWAPYQAVQTSYSGSVTAGGINNGTYTFYINNLDVHVPSSNYRQWKFWNVFIDIETRDEKHACKNLESTQDHPFLISGGSSSRDNIKCDIDMTIWPQYGGQPQELCRYASGTIKIKVNNGLQVKKVTLYIGKSVSYYGQGGMGTGGSAVHYMKAGEILNGYNITFNTNGGTVTIPSQTAENITLPNPGARPGYDFDGWYNGDTRLGDTGDKWKPTADATVTAHWTPRDDTKYKVEHYLMDVDGEGYTLTDTDSLEGTSDTEVTPDVNTYEGFTSPEKQTVNVNADGSRVVRYEYTRNKYEFTMGSDVGVSTEGSSENGTYYYGAELTLKSTTSDGYQWDRWSNGDTEPETTVTMPAGDFTIAPEVYPITYTITYKLNGGRIDYKKTTYNIETPTFYIENPKKKGYIFTGWTGTDIETSTTDLSVHVGSIGDRTFEATWGEDIYTIIFDGNGETSGSMDTVTVKPGESIKLPENGFVRDGYSFVGWYTTKNDRFGTFYRNEATITDLTESVTLHAQWKKNKDTVEPGENGNGSGNSGSGNGDGGSKDDHGNGGNGSGSGDDSGRGNDGNNKPVKTPEDEIGYFGTAFIRNEISIRTTNGINDNKLTLNYNY